MGVQRKSRGSPRRPACVCEASVVPGWLPDQPQEQASCQGAGNGSSYAEPNLFLGPRVGTAAVFPEA